MLQITDGRDPEALRLNHLPKFTGPGCEGAGLQPQTLAAEPGSTNHWTPQSFALHCKAILGPFHPREGGEGWSKKTGG